MACVDLPSGRVSLHQLPHVGRGPAEDVVMIHGLGANFGFWYGSAVQWFRRFGRVTLFDLPGHGGSAMPASGYTPGDLACVLGEMLDHLGIARPHLVAHSFGGMVALAFAARQPERVKSLVLADVRIWAIEPPSIADAATPAVARLREAGLTLSDAHLDTSVQVLVELARQRLERDAFDEPALSDVLPGARSLFPGRRAALQWLRLIETTRAYDEMTDPKGLGIAEIAGLTQPILAVYGGLSARKRSALALARTCPNCQLRLIPKVGHFFPLTRPRLFARPALRFLRATVREETAAQDTAARPRRRRRRPPPKPDLPAVPTVIAEAAPVSTGSMPATAVATPAPAEPALA